MLIESHGVVDEVFQTIGPPLLIVDAGTTVVTIPERFARSRRCVEIVLKIIVLQSVTKRCVKIMLLELQDIQFNVGITKQIDAVTLAHVFLKIVYRIVNVCRRVGLVVASIRILNRDCRIHCESCVKQSVVAPFLVYLTGRE